jgi:hypothetical protein
MVLAAVQIVLKRVGLVLVIIFVIISVINLAIMDRPQEVLECPLSNLPALPPRFGVREAKVNALVDAGDDYIMGCVREAVIGVVPWAETNS